MADIDFVNDRPNKDALPNGANVRFLTQESGAWGNHSWATAAQVAAGTKPSGIISAQTLAEYVTFGSVYNFNERIEPAGINTSSLQVNFINTSISLTPGNYIISGMYFYRKPSTNNDFLAYIRYTDPSSTTTNPYGVDHREEFKDTTSILQRSYTYDLNVPTTGVYSFDVDYGTDAIANPAIMYYASIRILKR